MARAKAGKGLSIADKLKAHVATRPSRRRCMTCFGDPALRGAIQEIVAAVQAEPDAKITASGVHSFLREEHGYKLSYAAFMDHLEKHEPEQHKVLTRAAAHG